MYIYIFLIVQIIINFLSCRLHFLMREKLEWLAWILWELLLTSYYYYYYYYNLISSFNILSELNKRNLFNRNMRLKKWFKKCIQMCNKFLKISCKFGDVPSSNLRDTMLWIDRGINILARYILRMRHSSVKWSNPIDSKCQKKVHLYTFIESTSGMSRISTHYFRIKRQHKQRKIIFSLPFLFENPLKYKQKMGKI